MSGCSARTAATPSRSIGWSSTTRTRIGWPVEAAVMSGLARLRAAGDEEPGAPAEVEIGDAAWDGQRDLGPRPGATADLEVGLDLARSLAHARQSEMALAAATVEHGLVQADAVVMEPHAERAAAIADADVDIAGLGVALCVEQGLRRDLLDFLADERMQPARRPLDHDPHL